MRSQPRFDFTKWYLDLVTDEGTLIIAYAATLDWAGLQVPFAATLVAGADGPIAESTAFANVVLPHVDEEGLRWFHPGLVAGRWRRTAAPLDAMLLDGPDGQLRWSCPLPAAEAEVEIGGEHLRGRGYVECLRMTLTPRSLPFDHLRWGRYVSSDHAAVWIAMNGGVQRRWTWLDACLQPDAHASDEGVTGCGGGRQIRFERVRTICDRFALDRLTRHLPPFARSLVTPIARLHETKRLDRGTLVVDGTPRDHGWVVHEVVTW